MAVKRALWSEDFPKFPSWPCPSCQDGGLATIKETYAEVETGQSKRGRQDEAWDPEWIEERFSALLKCKDEECGQIVAISGRTQRTIISDPDTGQSHVFKDYKPFFLYPAPPIFPLHSKCPKPVAAELRKAFAAIWSDTASCANHLRSAVELLLTDRGISRTTITKNRKRQNLTLHSRIEKYKAIGPEAADMLLAVKWIGNEGSHARLGSLSRDDLLDGFELFEHLIDIIYVKHGAALRKKARAINARKGRAPRRMRRRAVVA